jgi:hypothetical protein
MEVIMCEQHEVESWLKLVNFVFEGSNTLIVLDDCAASKDVKGRTGELVSLAFSARHAGISVWVVTQKFTSITPSFRENAAALVLFYTPSAKSRKSVFEEFGGDLEPDEIKSLVKKTKQQRFSCLVFAIREPYGVTFFGRK